MVVVSVFRQIQLPSPCQRNSSRNNIKNQQNNYRFIYWWLLKAVKGPLHIHRHQQIKVENRLRQHRLPCVKGNMHTHASGRK